MRPIMWIYPTDVESEPPNPNDPENKQWIRLDTEDGPVMVLLRGDMIERISNTPLLEPGEIYREGS